VLLIGEKTQEKVLNRLANVLPQPLQKVWLIDRVLEFRLA
jgi:hypothetical protein